MEREFRGVNTSHHAASRLAYCRDFPINSMWISERNREKRLIISVVTLAACVASRGTVLDTAPAPPAREPPAPASSRGCRLGTVKYCEVLCVKSCTVCLLSEADGSNRRCTSEYS